METLEELISPVFKKLNICDEHIPLKIKQNKKRQNKSHFVCVQISLSIMAAVVMVPVNGSILNKPLMDEDLIE